MPICSLKNYAKNLWVKIVSFSYNLHFNMLSDAGGFSAAAAAIETLQSSAHHSMGHKAWRALWEMQFMVSAQFKSWAERLVSPQTPPPETIGRIKNKWTLFRIQLDTSNDLEAVSDLHRGSMKPLWVQSFTTAVSLETAPQWLDFPLHTYAFITEWRLSFGFGLELEVEISWTNHHQNHQ